MTADLLALLESDPAAGILAVAELREQRAEAAPHGPWHWEAVGASGYPQRISNPEALVIAECFENPDFPASCAEFIAAEHPDVALAAVRRWRGVVERHRPVGTAGIDRIVWCSEHAVPVHLSDCPDLTEIGDEAKAYLGGSQ